MEKVSNVDLRLLRVFVAVAEAHGFAAAEPHLNLSTSTISVHMSRLEGRLGVRLCERGRGGFKLTERGHIVYRESKKILASLDDFAGILAGVRKTLAGRLCIGMADALVVHPLFPISEAIHEFNTVDNEVEFELIVGPRPVLEHGVFEGQAHAAIGPFVRATAGLKFTPLFTDPQDLYCGVSHPLFGASERQIAKADLSRHRSVVREFHRDFDHGRLGVQRPGAVVNSMEAMLALILSGDYIGYLPRYFAQQWVDQGELSRIGGPSGSYDSEHVIITRRTDRDAIALTKFLSILRDVVARRRSQLHLGETRSSPTRLGAPPTELGAEPKESAASSA